MVLVFQSFIFVEQMHQIICLSEHEREMFRNDDMDPDDQWKEGQQHLVYWDGVKM